jgi:acyl-CoA synthetase (AMP-forming)/AMP-acid ligase II
MTAQIRPTCDSSVCELLGCGTLVDLLLFRATQSPNALVFRFLADGDRESDFRTYRDIDIKARAIAGQLRRYTRPGDVAVLLFPPGLEFIDAFFGCLYAGVIAVPLYPPRMHRKDIRVEAIFHDCGAKVAITTDAVHSAIYKHQVSNTSTMLTLSVERLISAGDPIDPYPAIGDTVAYLQYTSGSTGRPRGVIATHSNAIANLRMSYSGFEWSPHEVMVSWLPHFHDMGMMGDTLNPIFAGFPCIKMPPRAFMQSPRRWLSAITRYRGTTIGGPNFAYDLCAREIAEEDKLGLDLRTLTQAYCGSEPIRLQTIRSFSNAFAQCGLSPRAFRPCYGLAETTLAASVGRRMTPAKVEYMSTQLIGMGSSETYSQDGEDAHPIVSCGQPLPESRVIVVDPANGRQLDDRMIGEIWISGPHVSPGYLKHTEDTPKIFLAFTTSGDGPFLRTGDLGFLCDGELFVTGRLKDLIIVRGRNVYPQDIEVIAEAAHPALRPGASAAFSLDSENGEMVVFVCEVNRCHRTAHIPEVAAAVRRAVAAEHDVHVHSVALLKPGAIPKTTSGKIRRHACRQAYLAEQLEELGRDTMPTHVLEESDSPDSSDESRVLVVLREELAKIVNIRASDIKADQRLNDFGLDSLMAVSLQAAIETHANVILPIDAFLDGWTLAEIVAGAKCVPAIPKSAPLIIHAEDSISRIVFNVMPGRQIEETLTIKEYRVWHRYAEGRFDRAYKSEMLNSPDHLIFLTALMHAQKLAYVCLCHELGIFYNPNMPERFKMWPTSVRVRMPALVTQVADVVQRLWVTELRKKNENTFFMKVRTSVESIEIDVESPVFLI